MDLSGVSQSSCDKVVENIGESPEKKSFSNSSDEIDSKSITGAQLPTCSSLVMPKTACLPTKNLGNLTVQTKLNSDISSSKISTSSSLPELNSSKQGVSEFKTDCRSQLESPTTHSSNCIPTCTRVTDPLVTYIADGNMSGGTPDTIKRDFIEHPNKAVKEADILSAQSLPTTDQSICETTCQKVSSTTPIEDPNLLEKFDYENDVPIELELMADACTRYLRVRKINEQLREEFQNKIDKFLSQNKAESTSNVIPEDNQAASTSTENTN